MANIIWLLDGEMSLDPIAAKRNPRKEMEPHKRKNHPQNTLSFEPMGFDAVETFTISESSIQFRKNRDHHWINTENNAQC